MENLLAIWAGLSPDERQISMIGAFVLCAVFFGYMMYKLEMLARDLMGSYKMRKRARLSKEVCEILEDRFVDGLTEAIEAKRITIEDARVIYARLAHLGFWGLHPRKVTPKKTPEQLNELKERIKAERSARANSNGKPVNTSEVLDKLLDGLEAELATSKP